MSPVKTKRGRLLSSDFVRGSGEKLKLHNKEHFASKRKLAELEKNRLLRKKAKPKEKQTNVTRIKTILRVLEKHSIAKEKIDNKKQDFLLKQFRNLGEIILQINGKIITKRLGMLVLVSNRTSIMNKIKELEKLKLVRRGFTKEAKKAFYPKKNTK